MARRTTSPANPSVHSWAQLLTWHDGQRRLPTPLCIHGPSYSLGTTDNVACQPLCAFMGPVTHLARRTTSPANPSVHSWAQLLTWHDGQRRLPTPLCIHGPSYSLGTTDNVACQPLCAFMGPVTHLARRTTSPANPSVHSWAQLLTWHNGQRRLPTPLCIHGPSYSLGKQMDVCNEVIRLVVLHNYTTKAPQRNIPNMPASQ